MCKICLNCIKQNKIPTKSLANGLWLGEVPGELRGLTFIEKLLVSRVRLNRCIVKVASSGSRKMVANSIAFKHPSQKIYTTLPPPLVDLDDILACVFTGPHPPTSQDLQRTSLLVQRQKVLLALKWLVINHQDYADLNVSIENLNEYPEDKPPVVMDFRKDSGVHPLESRSVNDPGDDDDTESGPCPLSVHGITGEDYSDLPVTALKSIALHHLQTGD
ncbi:hypothetical protein BDN67DRAFT_909124 [Paxillus ammoniavirescens]|nr:hypothetical protein BDN67DRAFT_909124 [Paxillus ammoniavirescens]